MQKRFYIILLMLLALSIAFFLAWFNYKNTTALSRTIANLQKPDTRLADLKQLVLNVNTAESQVRSFAITRNKKNLEAYYTQMAQTDSQLISFKNQFNDNSLTFDSLNSLVHKKFEIYDKLIELRYQQLIKDAMNKISGKVSDIEDYNSNDTISGTKSGLFKRLFTSGKRIRELEEKAHLLDSLNELQAQKLSNIKKTIVDTEGNEIKLVADLSAGELLLLDQDRQLKEQLQRQVQSLEEMIRKNNEKKSLQVIRQTREQMATVMIATLAASLFILTLSLIILTDISRANRYKIQLEEARAKSEQLARFKEEFLATMSHEIRTPLSALTGFTHQLSQTNTTSEQKQMINTITMAGQHLLSIVNDVLDLSRIETGKLVFNQQPFSVYNEVNDVVLLMQQKAKEKNIAIITDTNTIKNNLVLGDALRLRQILINIVGNAIKFTEKGSVRLSVHVNEPDDFVFRISDTGIGIPADKITSLFNPYQQAENIEKTYGGTGLGLAITKKMVELQGGTIQLNSEQGKGTTVTIVLKFPATEMPKPFANPPDNESLKGQVILVAEDDPLNLQLAVSALNDLGADIIQAIHGKQAIEQILLRNPDAVLMDIQMPEMNGLQATRFIREHISKNLPIIGLTANMMNDAHQECLIAGMNKVVLKPLEFHSIIPELKKLIAAHHATHQSTQSIYQYSLTHLFKTSNGKSDFVIKMLKLFISSNQSLMEKSLSFAKQGDYQQTAASIHRMIPGFRQLELDQFADILKNLEWLYSESSDKKNLASLLEQCMNQFGELRKNIEQEITRMESEHTT
jgi:signal transduction histidine kinase/DNA-binding NarL/FixJ family response regulator